MLVACSTTNNINSGDSSVSFLDSNLENVIRETLNKSIGNISSGDLKTLTFFGADKQSISSLEGLEHATNLKRFYLWSNNINDITPLENLTNVQGLYLYSNNISDISLLQNFTDLKILGLGGNSISDIKALVDNSGLG